MINLICGLPGSGKSTYAHTKAAELGGPVIEADQFMVDAEGNYAFDPTRLVEAHGRCLLAAAMNVHTTARRNVWVANTFTTAAEMLPYVAVARASNVPIAIHHIFDGGLDDVQLAARNAHGVPEVAIAAMRARYQHTTTEDLEAFAGVSLPRVKKPLPAGKTTRAGRMLETRQ